jgi:hypothetical protein
VLKIINAIFALASLLSALVSYLIARRYFPEQRLARWLLMAHDRIGSDKFPAPQGTLMATLVKGLLSFNLDWQFVLVGAFLSITMELCGVKSLSFAVGAYLPLSTTLPIFIGGAIKGIADWQSKKKNEEIEEIDISEFTTFLELVKSDYQNSGQTLRTSLDKFKDRYIAARALSIPRLSSFLYDLKRDLDPMVRVKSGANIRVQVESIKRRKIEGGSSKRRLPTANNSKGKKIRILWLFQPVKREKRARKNII